ncbi:MAG: sigma-70 family RNA polymerase sigma factor, partial [Vicinamibacteria bacterium]|nr:sigma-70 family RNA polymerase sigma factor [Vicinamibacteria bacterium]
HDDLQLLVRCREGDELAWRTLVLRHALKVYALILRWIGRADEAEDLTQAVFMQVSQDLGAYQETAAGLGGWLAVIARHQVVDRWRKSHAHPEPLLSESEILSHLPALADNPEPPLMPDEAGARMQRELASLPKDLRLPLSLKEIDRLEYAEIAEALDLPLGTVKSRINRARLELARRRLGRAEGER